VLDAFVVNFVRFLALGLELLILARVLLSWVDPAGRGRLAAFIVSTTEPILAPIRRLLPRSVVILVLGVVLQAVR
jgi:YggT family protein